MTFPFDLVATRFHQYSLIMEACRLFHGRGDVYEGYENLVIDFYPPFILITCYKSYLCPDEISDFLVTLTENENIIIRSLALRSDFTDKNSLQRIIQENNLKYEVELMKNQLTGFFLDMKPLRNFLATDICVKNKKILNLFSYTCSLSVAALAGGASQVINVDMKDSVLRRGEKNHALNFSDGQPAQRRSKFLKLDILKNLKRLVKHGPYGIVIVDPPSDQGESFSVARDYKKILRTLGEMVEPNGFAFLCLNSPHISKEEFRVMIQADLHGQESLKWKEIMTLGPAHEFDEGPDKMGALKILIYQYC